MPEDFGPNLKLATKQQLVEELTGRKDTPAIVIYRILTANGDPMWCYSHNIPTDQTVPDILCELAKFFEASTPTYEGQDIL